MVWVLALHLVNITKIVLNNKVIEEPEVIVNTFNNFSIKLEQLWLKNYQKAFDMVDHGILLRKLAEININKSLWLWIQCFLDGQQVKLNYFLSSVSSCPAGVPQGSVISPTLFNVHINDIEDSVPNSIAVDTHKYADDCTLDQSVKEGDVSQMQEVLNSMQTWADFNKMTLNSKKTKDLWICFRDCISEPPPLTIGGETIERTSSFKLLGVWHQNTLKWNDHVKEITKKANRRMFCLRECRWANLPTEVGMTCYMTKIRPLLEYGSPVWAGIPQYLVDELESIQAWSLRILGIPKDSLPSLHERRDKQTIKEYERTINDILNLCNNFIPFPVRHLYDLRNQTTRDRPLIRSFTDRHKQSFIPRAVSLLY